jgi:hypothetical protein
MKIFDETLRVIAIAGSDQQTSILLIQGNQAVSIILPAAAFQKFSAAINRNWRFWNRTVVKALALIHDKKTSDPGFTEDADNMSFSPYAEFKADMVGNHIELKIWDEVHRLRVNFTTEGYSSFTAQLKAFEMKNKDAVELAYKEFEARLQAIKNKVLHKQVVEVSIYIPGNINVLEGERITNASGDFMEALGFELKTEDEPILNSFWQKLKFVFKKNVTAEELEQVFTKGKRALEFKYLEIPAAERTAKLAAAAASLLPMLNEYPELAIRLGALIIVKRMVTGRPALLIHQLTIEQEAFIEQHPSLLYQPQELFSFIERAQAAERQAAIAAATEATEDSGIITIQVKPANPQAGTDAV